MMDRMTIRGDHGVFLEPHWDFCIAPNDYDLLQQILGRLAIFEDLLEDQDMEPEEFVAAYKSASTENALLNMTARYLRVTPALLRKLSGEEVSLALAAGARAIDNNKRLVGASYCQDIFGKCGGPKMIRYYRAAELLNELAAEICVRNEVIE